MHRRFLLAAPTVLAATARAQAWPDGQVRVVSPYTPGGASDLTARFVAQAITAATGATAIVENRPGAGGNTGAEAVARVAPDGRTLLIVAAAHAVSQSLYPKLGYDLLRDFVPIVQVVAVPNLLAVHPDIPARTTAEFIAFAKSRADGIAYGSAGVGTLPHLGMELLRQRAGFQAVHIPFRGSAPAIQELVAGRLQAVYENVPPLLGQVRDNRVRALGIGSARPHPDLPDVPPIAATPGLEGFEADAWQSVMAPAGLPRPVAERIAAIVTAALADPAAAQPLLRAGAIPSGLALDDFARFVATETGRWRGVIQTAGIRLE